MRTTPDGSIVLNSIEEEFNGGEKFKRLKTKRMNYGGNWTQNCDDEEEGETTVESKGDRGTDDIGTGRENNVTWYLDTRHMMTTDHGSQEWLELLLLLIDTYR